MESCLRKKVKINVMLMLITLIMLGIIAGCGTAKAPAIPNQPEPGGTDMEIVFERGIFRPEDNQLPEEIKKWISISREVQAVQERVFEGNRYVLITDGMRPTGGFSVEVQEAIVQGENLEVRIKTIEPKEGQMVTEAITHPYDLVIVENTTLPLEYVSVDNPNQYFMRVMDSQGNYGIINQEIVAFSYWVKIYTPEPNQKVEGSINLSGLANVYEGTVNYELLDGNGNAILEGFTTAAMGDWMHFQETIEIPQEHIGKPLQLEVFTISPKDGAKDQVIEVPINK
ncbi:hypothetical protein BHU72_13500 [Desulfuribacillus stibiiarsenatis]|uniref:PrcB C-terminal domain-containing protein n=1 Tax=Desulfuribacillus stibiiarsenatis TaxID=1390249 RepID=A0A1E5L8N8_9FIRM|nr:Gmad2 immunoglobulin-like domain-containing protein [Desulfuribacillus stibiiarsenatis]OEH86428.1 hypothetical protein BHU72_13500 [Desulfuribacillus stibiiarsenatis]